MASIRILGLSAYYHDSAACLLVDWQIAAAAQEEQQSEPADLKELAMADTSKPDQIRTLIERGLAIPATT